MVANLQSCSEFPLPSKSPAIRQRLTAGTIGMTDTQGGEEYVEVRGAQRARLRIA